jgi:hypothetical protein
MNAGPWLMGARDLRSVVRGSKRPLHSLAILSGQLLRSANGILELPEIEYHLTTPKIPSEEIRETVATARFPEVDLDQLPASGGSQARSGRDFRKSERICPSCQFAAPVRHRGVLGPNWREAAMKAVCLGSRRRAELGNLTGSTPLSGAQKGLRRSTAASVKQLTAPMGGLR